MLDKTIRFRLIGVVILVVISAAVLPIILDGERPPELDVNIQIEPAPTIANVKISPLQPITSLGANGDLDSQPEIKVESIKKDADQDRVSKHMTVEKVDVVKAPVTISPAKSIASVAKPALQKESRWSVQIATFKSKTNADNLVKKLIKANYSAYSITTNSLYKVYVGPEIKREKAELFRDQIKKEFRLNGLIVKYSEN
ncbi:SPOR domain-containing protein [Marinomonas sp. 15G1-11]|uniref:SPOR domain-containing protein n=1 Tax=Marinomonas phaeophyticola TaxID=3004091 RepID=A0ABT4JRB5_9GAMM|nr:SPOR domain-containing protein [Marinomonas sp. 15G1-11]MCZ2720363.1 SPOR domain-containing protein [Marinomonas sp. 15G1-11]